MGWQPWSALPGIRRHPGQLLALSSLGRAPRARQPPAWGGGGEGALPQMRAGSDREFAERVPKRGEGEATISPGLMFCRLPEFVCFQTLSALPRPV